MSAQSSDPVLVLVQSWFAEKWHETELEENKKTGLLWGRLWNSGVDRGFLSADVPPVMLELLLLRQQPLIGMRITDIFLPWVSCQSRNNNESHRFLDHIFPVSLSHPWWQFKSEEFLSRLKNSRKSLDRNPLHLLLTKTYWRLFETPQEIPCLLICWLCLYSLIISIKDINESFYVSLSF